MDASKVADLLSDLVQEAPDLAPMLSNSLMVTHSPRVVASKADFIQIAPGMYATSVVGILNGLLGEEQRLVPVTDTNGTLVAYTVNTNKQEAD